MKALTPAALTRATGLFAYSALPSPRPTLNSPGLPFRPQPRDPSDSRFLSRLSAIGHSRLRHYPAGSPRVHAETGSCSYRLAVRLQLLPTTPLGGAVTFGYKVTTYSDRDFHPADKASSRTHWMPGTSPAMTMWNRQFQSPQMSYAIALPQAGELRRWFATSPSLRAKRSNPVLRQVWIASLRSQ